MKKRIIALLCFAACLQVGWAQNTVESIRQRYNAMKEYIATHQGNDQYDGAEWGNWYHLEVRQWLPGTGGHVEETYFYYDEEEPEDEDVIYPPHYVKFITKKFNYAARKFHQEFLYDEDGSVAFIYSYDPMTSFDGDEHDMEYEFRFYLNKGKMIKGIVKRKDGDAKEFKEVWSGSTIKPIYKESFEEFVGNAKMMRQLFLDIEREAY